MLSLTMSIVKKCSYVLRVLAQMASSLSASSISALCRALTSPAMPSRHFLPTSIHFSSSEVSILYPLTRPDSESVEKLSSVSGISTSGILTFMGFGRRNSSSSESSGLTAWGLRGYVLGFVGLTFFPAASGLGSEDAGLRFAFFSRPSSFLSFLSFSFFSFFSFFSCFCFSPLPTLPIAFTATATATTASSPEAAAFEAARATSKCR
mmetsp:Transcript_12570/g.48971  ORF Transcript_12570/g.48971 Transcript_12570/m.48971 type:complete len:207 (+) Transcript_12570:1672-2292(+)